MTKREIRHRILLLGPSEDVTISRFRVMRYGSVFIEKYHLFVGTDILSIIHIDDIIDFIHQEILNDYIDEVLSD